MKKVMLNIVRGETYCDICLMKSRMKANYEEDV